MSGKQQPIDIEPVLEWIRTNSTDGIGPARSMYHSAAAAAGLPSYSSLQLRKWTWPLLLDAAGVQRRQVGRPMSGNGSAFLRAYPGQIPPDVETEIQSIPKHSPSASPPTPPSAPPANTTAYAKEHTMITDTILHKYMRHLRHMNGGGYTSMDAVELALRLALDDLAESIPSIPSTSSTELAALQADLERLQTAADTEVAELRKQLNELDADNAALIRRNKELVDSLHISQNGTGLAVKNPPFVDSAPSAISNQQSPINNSMWSDPNMLNTLDDIARDWWIGVAAGRHQWRSVPKPVQLQLVRHVLSFGPETGSMKMTDFDAIKPDWMPGSGSHTKTLGLSWQQLNDWSIEL